MLMVPLGDASRRTTGFPVVTTSIVVINVLVFLLELLGGAPFEGHFRGKITHRQAT